MTESKLYAFGCSNTYGHGLPDCKLTSQSPHYPPSNMGWVSIVAKHLNLPYINLSWPGASVKETMFRFKECHDITKDDTVIILWTYPSRWCVISDAKSYDIERYVPANPDDISKKYFKYFHHGEDAYIMNEVFITYVQNKLDKIGCNYKFIFSNYEDQIRYRKAGIKMMNIVHTQFDNGKDRTECGHMGLQGNIDFANAIIKEAF